MRAKPRGRVVKREVRHTLQAFASACEREMFQWESEVGSDLATSTHPVAAVFRHVLCQWHPSVWSDLWPDIAKQLDPEGGR